MSKKAIALLIGISIILTAFFITVNHTLLDIGDGNCEKYWDTCVYYCHVTGGCAQEYHYAYPGIMATYPLTLLGFKPFILAMLFLSIFLPSFLLYRKTNNLIFSMSWMFLDITYLNGAGMFSQALISSALMALLLFENWEMNRLTRGAMYLFMILSHKLGFFLVLFLFVLEGKETQWIFRIKWLKFLGIILMAVALLIVCLKLPTPFEEIEFLPSSLYMLWVSIPLILISIQNQSNVLKNKAIISYCMVLVFAVALITLYVRADKNIEYIDFTRTVAMLDLFSIAFIAKGKHDQKTLTYLTLLLCVSFFYRWLVSPYAMGDSREDKWTLRIV